MTRQARRARRDPNDPSKHRSTHLRNSIYSKACARASQLGITYSAYVERLIAQDRIGSDEEE